MINFIDVGANSGGVTDQFIKIANRLKLDYKCYLFECQDEMVKLLREKYEDNPQVVIIDSAISNVNGTIKLYASKRSLGHSIFKDKVNVNENKFQIVSSIRLSDWLKTNINESDFNILKSNIEAANYYLYNDIIDTKTYKYIDIHLGNQCNDVRKIPSLADKVDDFFKKIEDHDIKLYYYSNSKYGKRGGNVDLETLIKDRI